MWCTQNTKDTALHAPKGPNWTSGYATAEDGRIVYDMYVVKFVLQHTKLRHWFNPKRLIIAAIYAQPMLLGDFRIPETKDWKFFDEEFDKTWASN